MVGRLLEEVMSRIPEPDATPDGPAYEGRLLDRAEEEVVDQGVAFDIRTLISRRGVLTLIGYGVGAVALAACSSGTTSSVATDSAASLTGEIPDETAGPYPGDGSNGADVLEQSGIVRSDIRSSINGGATATGVPMALTLTIVDIANGNRPFADAAVYVWHCDSGGGYSMYSDGITNETYLRGVQVADSDGKVSFTSIFPACYAGRWPHIHFEVYPDVNSITEAASVIATSQVAIPQDACTTVYARDGYSGSSANLAQVSLESDNVFGDDGGASQLATVTGDSDAGYRVSLTARVDTTTKPGGGSPPGHRN
jgi:protocatechuate 3,4-dioxygenase beta subunit